MNAMIRILLTTAVLGLACGACRNAGDETRRSGATGEETGKVVWIDTDPSVAPGGHEVDDGFALIQAFHSPELEIRGVSVVFGNAELDRAVPIAREIVTRFGPPGLPLHAGASGSHQLGEETEASRALAAALGREKLTILALGPVTNVATVLKNRPNLGGQVREIVAVAGRRPGQRFTPGPDGGPSFRDFNFELDPEAFLVLLESNVSLVLAPWEVSSKVWLREDELRALEAGSDAARYLHAPALDWLRLWEREFGVAGFNPFDTLAVAWVATPRWLRCEDLPAEIRTLPDDVDPGAADRSEKPFLIVSRQSDSGRTVRYCHDVSDEFKGDLMARLLRR